jgi:putative Mn2+ efflux pump MntP
MNFPEIFLIALSMAMDAFAAWSVVERDIPELKLNIQLILNGLTE